MIPATQHTFRRVYSHRLGAPGPADASYSAKATDASALQWLAGQSADLVDACLAPLSAQDRAHLGQGLTLAAPQRSRGRPHHLQSLVGRVAASNHQAVARTVAPGPLRAALLDGLDTPQPQDYDSSHWVRINSMRCVARDEVQRTCAAWAARWPVAAQQPLFADAVTAVRALDRLSLAAPHTVAWQLNGRERAAAHEVRAGYRQAGREALVLASWLSGPMQHTLLARVVVATALAFMGRAEAAEGIFAGLDDDPLRASLRTGVGANGLHLAQLLHDPERFPDRCLMWLKAAALAGDAPNLYAVYERALQHIPRIDNRWPTPSDLNTRWPILDSSQRLGYDPDWAWAEATGQHRMAQYIMSLPIPAAPF